MYNSRSGEPGNEASNVCTYQGFIASFPGLAVYGMQIRRIGDHVTCTKEYRRRGEVGVL